MTKNNTICIDSDVLFNALNKVAPYRNLKLDAENGILIINDGIKTVSVNCHTSNDFKTTMYDITFQKLYAFLKTIRQQPISFCINDSETFNLKIIEAYL